MHAHGVELELASLPRGLHKSPSLAPLGGHGQPLGSQHWAGDSGTRTVTVWD